jgi:endonuclease/exonuclease/phosphatase family metal-dependent hydrolase
MSSNKAGGIKYKKDYKNLLKPEEVMKNSINYLHPLRI